MTARPAPARFWNTDIFAGVNAVLFLVFGLAAYYERFLQYRGRGNLHEFLIYAAFVFAIIGGAWLSLRRSQIPSYLLIFMQVGILAHFAGAMVPVHGKTLYEAHVLGVPYDKFVHFLNAFAGSAIVSHLFNLRVGHVTKTPVPVHPLAILTVVLGVGSVVEIVEYIVQLVMPHTGVGGYDNNMQDLIANLVGGGAFLLVRALAPKAAAATAGVHAKA